MSFESFFFEIVLFVYFHLHTCHPTVLTTDISVRWIYKTRVERSSVNVF